MSLSLLSFNDTASTETYTLSLHDALPIYKQRKGLLENRKTKRPQQHERGDHPHVIELPSQFKHFAHRQARTRSEEHTSELQSRGHLVCRLLLEKKKKQE